MDFDRQNKLPEGVGKKIIEVLKTNRGREIEDSSDYELPTQSNYMENPRYSNYDLNNEGDSLPEYVDYTYNYESDIKSSISEGNDYNIPLEYREQKINIPENPNRSSIDTLVDLVTKLPPGVTKQTGAQIIRHTMEAMGIPMNKVLGNAQMAQEELEQSIRNNINVIEEYRAKIKNLDNEIQQFRKKAHDLEDIISLFILSENSKKF